MENVTCGGRTASFEFVHQVDGVAYPTGLPDENQRQFKKRFCDELQKLETWFRKEGWLQPNTVSAPRPVGSHTGNGLFGLAGTDFSVSVSNEYQLARALVPSALGQRGRMEFPLLRVRADQANVVHELTHVYFPNGNRLLAEGFAVYVQQIVGTNAAFPNFKGDLRAMARGLASTWSGGLYKVDLGQLDTISTPDHLTLQINERWLDSRDTYLVAGSFVQYLLEVFPDVPEKSPGVPDRMGKFRELYHQTPLRPMGRNGGTPARWQAVYGRSLEELEKAWAQWL